MRIVAGQFKRKRLFGPTSDAVRPTSDRTRETLFNVLQHGLHLSCHGLRVIDLFAGTGALGLEALSRGAAFCLFVEHSAQSRALIRMNVEALGQTGSTRLYRRDVRRLDQAGTMGRFQLAFLDPPYGQNLGPVALNALARGEWLDPGAICVLEERASIQIDAPTEFECIDQRHLGETQLAFFRFKAS